MSDKTWIEQLREHLTAKHAPITKNQSAMDEIEALERGPQAVDTSSGTAKGYANGGIVDQDFYQQLQDGTAMAPEPMQFDPKAGMPPEPAPQMPVGQPTMPLQAPNPINQYLDTQKASINKYGPEEQLALSQSLQKQHGGLRQTGARALGTLADGIMQGVARAGSGGFADRIAGDQNAQDKLQMDSLEKAGTQNLERVSANQKLDAMDPRSELSQAAQKSWAGVLAQTGIKPDQIVNMSASNIAAITGQSVEIVKAKAEADMAKASLGLNTAKAGEDVRHNKEGEHISAGNLAAKELEDKRGALKETASHYITHPVNAFKASGELGRMGLDAPTNVAPYGNETTRNGKTYVWHPDSGKYYLKGV